MPLKLTTYSRGKDIPELPGENIFHSRQMFLLYEAVKGYNPILIVATDDGIVVGKILGVIRRNTRLIPAWVARRCEIMGTGEYFGDNTDKEFVFGEILAHLTKEALRHSAVITFRNLQHNMFGYKYFRQNRYFGVNWLRVRNSLHDIDAVETRFSPSRIRQIKKGIQNGALVSETDSMDEIREFSRMLQKIYASRLRKYFPSFDFFKKMCEQLVNDKLAKIFVVRYKGKIIGGSVCVYSASNAYLWFSGGMRKSYVKQYPGVLAVWQALRDAYENGYRHLEFMDVGLPFRKHGYREFVLRFGGKQSSTRRWFRFRWNLLNNLMIRIYS